MIFASPSTARAPPRKKASPTYTQAVGIVSSRSELKFKGHLERDVPGVGETKRGLQFRSRERVPEILKGKKGKREKEKKGKRKQKRHPSTVVNLPDKHNQRLERRGGGKDTINTQASKTTDLDLDLSRISCITTLPASHCVSLLPEISPSYSPPINRDNIEHPHRPVDIKYLSSSKVYLGGESDSHFQTIQPVQPI